MGLGGGTSIPFLIEIFTNRTLSEVTADENASTNSGESGIPDAADILYVNDLLKNDVVSALEILSSRNPTMISTCVKTHVTVRQNC